MKLSFGNGPLTIISALLLGGGLLLRASITWPESLENGEIETLEVIEIPGTAVNLEERQFVFPKPELHNFQEIPSTAVPLISAEFNINHNLETASVAVDPIGKKRGIISKPQPLKIGRPPYPRIAREQGWEGTVILTLTIGPDGRVSSAKLQTSSGYPILDTIALEAAHDWFFQPQKDGEFPVGSKVNVPVRFNLHEKK